MSGRVRHLALAICGLSCVLCHLAGGAEGPRVGLQTDQARTVFPYSSAVDFSFRLDPPAGKHGFLQVDGGGHFQFEDGLRARFWGVNIAKESVFVGHDTIDQVVDVLARAGVNLVRFHHLDGEEGLLDGAKDDTLGYFNARKLDALDYWISRLKERGIYVYLDLLDYRTFTQEEGVVRGPELGRAAKPYAVFDPRLIELQEEYASKLLVEHVNPYTQLSYAQDPTVCLLEIFDENGLFSRRRDLLVLKSPYRQELTAQWNEWLQGQYGSTERLRAAWTDARGATALLPFESLEKGNVGLPALSLRPADAADNFGREGMARKNDGARFFYAVHRRFFDRMRDFLRERGVRVPLGAVGSLEGMPDLKATVDALDYVGINYYWDHPFWRVGQEWTPPYFFTNRNPLNYDGTGSLAVAVALSRMKGKPLVIREWSYCWPNEYRSLGVVEMAALCGLQDVDAAIAFTFGTQPDTRAAGLFDFHTDPARWGLFALSAKAFLSGEISPAKNTVDVAYSAVDIFSFFGYYSPIYRLAWVTRLQNVFYDTQYDATADLTIASGRSASGRLRGQHLILFNNTDLADLSGRSSSSSLAELSGYRLPEPVVADQPYSGEQGTGNGEQGTRNGEQGTGNGEQGTGNGEQGTGNGEQGTGNDTAVAGPGARPNASDDQQPTPSTLHAPRSTRPEGTWFSVPAIAAAGYRPLEVNPSLRWARGFFDPKRENYVFSRLPAEEVARLGFRILSEASGQPLLTSLGGGARLRSDTGQIVRNAPEATLSIDTPTTQAVATARGSGVWMGTSDLRIQSPCRTYSVIATSLDGLPLGESQHYVIKMVTVAANDGEKRLLVSSSPPAHRIVETGEGPPTSLGRSSSQPTRISLAGQELCAIYMLNGAWELVRDGETFLLFCDADGVRVDMSGQTGTVVAGAALAWKTVASGE